MRPASQDFYIHSCIYLRIFLALIAFLCWCAIKQPINQLSYFISQRFWALKAFLCWRAVKQSINQSSPRSRVKCLYSVQPMGWRVIGRAVGGATSSWNWICNAANFCFHNWLIIIKCYFVHNNNNDDICNAIYALTVSVVGVNCITTVISSRVFRHFAGR